MLYDNITVSGEHLKFAGFDTVDLAKKYGTPLYLMDEERIRARMREYKTAMAEFMPDGSVPEFASKAMSIKRIYEIAAEEGIDIDVVSPGEIYTAKAAGFPLGRAFFHGNNKTQNDIAFAMENGIGYFVVDNITELENISALAKKQGITQKVLIRVSPGIDPHTHKKISTGSTESKFGFPLETGDAEKAVLKAAELEGIKLCGVHCHIGSQIFETEPFLTAGEIMAKFILDVMVKNAIPCEILNIGGGLGVKYTEDEPEIDYYTAIRQIAENIKKCFADVGLPVPVIHMEPGRSIVADAGLTLYTVGSVKEIAGYKNYVSIDGGMTDNPRYTLYEAVHTVYNASNPNGQKDYIATVAGRCCESGDLIGEDVAMPKPNVGDILAVATTGAYNYSMASNYNRVPRPPVVMLSKDGDYLAVKRETLEDLIRLDI